MKMPRRALPQREAVDQPQATCDTCGSVAYRLVAAPSPHRCRTVMCTRCGHMFASPWLTPERLATFYDDEFTGDGLDLDPAVAAKRAAAEEALTQTWALPLVASVLQPRDARVLVLRCRTGALAHGLQQAGAHLTAVDPFPVNADAARARGVRDVREVPLLTFAERLPDGPFDAIVALDVHVLAHVPSPQRLLRRLRASLTRRGVLILDEKDILRPTRRQFRERGPFDSGIAHGHHFTAATLDRALTAAGFAVTDVRASRATAFHHCVFIAIAAPSTAMPPLNRATPVRLWWLMRTWRVRGWLAEVVYRGRRWVQHHRVRVRPWRRPRRLWKISTRRRAVTGPVGMSERPRGRSGPSR